MDPERALPPALGLAGVAAVLGALQAEALLVFADPWLAWWPRLEGLLGVVAVVASVRVVALRPGGRALAGLATLPMLLAGPPFAWTLLQHGVLTGMPCRTGVLSQATEQAGRRGASVGLAGHVYLAWDAVTDDRLDLGGNR